MNDAPSTSHEHPAPSAYRPLSGGAITALVLAILLAVAAFTGPWWLEVVPLAIAALAWGGISDGRRRGAGVAIAACVIALLAGVGAFFFVQRMTEEMQALSDKFMAALDKDDRATLTPWVLKGEDPKATLDAWHTRYAAAQVELGAYSGSTVIRTGLWGPMFSLLRAPEDVTEIAPAPGSAAPGTPAAGTAEPGEPPEAIAWFEAAFARGRAYVAVVFGPADGSQAELKEAMKGGGGHVPIVREVRFFRASTGGK